MKGMRKRKRWLVVLAIAFLAVCGSMWNATRPTPPPSYLAKFGDRVTLVEESGYYVPDPDTIAGFRVYAVQESAENILPELERLGRLSAHYFQAPVPESRRWNGIPVEISVWGDGTGDGLPSLVPARPVRDLGAASENVPSDGWSTVYIFWSRKLTPMERSLRSLHIPWEKWRFGEETPLLYIKDRSSKLVDVYKRAYPDDYIEEHPAGPGLTDLPPRSE